MPGRKYEPASGYRYGFNGKEKDKDMNSLTAYDYGFRIYNPAIGKFLTVDPLTKKYPELTSYQFASNRPIDGIDLDGLEYYFASNGSLIHRNGESTEVNILNDDQVKQVTIDGKVDVNKLTPSSGYKISHGYTTIKATVDVLNRQVKNGGNSEESAIVFNDIVVRHYPAGAPATILADGTYTGRVGIPTFVARDPNWLLFNLNPEKVSIHGHMTDAVIKKDKPDDPSNTDWTGWSTTANEPTQGEDQDRGTFRSYVANIIVGRLERATYYTSKGHNNETIMVAAESKLGAVFYDSNTKKIFEMTRAALKKIEEKLSEDKAKKEQEEKIKKEQEEKTKQPNG